MDCQPVHSNLVRRLKRGSVTKIHNIRLSNETETLLGRLKEHLKGTAETDKPSTSVVVRRALTIYGNVCLPLSGQSLIEERKTLVAQTYLPMKRRPVKAV